MSTRDSSKRDVAVQVTASVCGPDTLFFRMDCGTATDEDGKKFELSTNVGGGSPIVRLPDGRWVTFSWQTLIEAAVAAVKQ